MSSFSGKKEIAESLRFQGLRVTESYDVNEPDLVVWKDELNPSEVISLKSFSANSGTVNVASECTKEISFAQKYSFDKIRLICLHTLSKKKMFDSLVSFNDKIQCNLEGEQQPEPQKIEQKNVNPSQKKNRLNLDLKFVTSPVNITDRVIAVSDAFGVGLDDQKEFTIFDKVDLQYDDSDLIYVTGDSGSGKSTFLKIFKNHLQQQNVSCGAFEDVKPDNEEVVINSVGETQEDAFSLLATVGLSEAFLMLRKYKELSEGQKYRYKLAKLIACKSQVLLIDEFGATLDREMAKVLAFCMQKWARRNNKMVVIATTHKDLIQDFNPNIIIDKKFGQTTEIKHYAGEMRPFSLMEQMQIQAASKEDYELLKGFHYLAGRAAGVKGKYKLVFGSETVGIILYTTSMRALRFRNQLFPEYKNNIQKVNAEIQRISRVIIHPKYRGIGLAQELVRLTLPLVNARLVETVAAMAKYNPFFEKAGMTLVGKMQWQPGQIKMKDFIEKAGSKVGLLHNKPLCKAFINQLNAVQFAELQKILANNIKGAGGASPGRMDGLNKKMADGNFTDVLMELLPVERVYLYWLNPAWQAENRTPTQSGSG